ncbi:hypothetical protein KUCAC02_033746 [Chaenocephalus aceratus]|nr:hypothetical protein KUCAC02_033746 [Chaenocephalus aceratus]
MHHSGIYPKVREVIDLDSREQLQLPAASTGGSPQRGVGKRHTIEYLADCELHKKRSTMTQSDEAVYMSPLRFSPLPLAQWFETVHANEILGHLEEMKGIITSTYGRILKLDSTKKITKKLAGAIADTATWMTNVSNECGEVLNCVLTTGEGAGLEDLCQGIVKHYQDAGEPEPEVIYVDRDCCNDTGLTPVQVWFRPWKTQVKLDIFHYMRRFTTGLTTEHHPLYGTFCSKMSSCIFEWDKDDISHLKDAKTSELKKLHAGQTPSEAQVLANISSSELAKHCRRRTRGIEESRALIQDLLNSMWELTDTSGLRLINPESMTRVWEVQQKHLPCIQDPPGVELYTKVGSGLQKGSTVLDVLRCGRGSSSVESFHRHQNTFIPGWRSNAMHTQMYMLEGSSRWNMNRAHAAVHVSGASQTRIYNVRLKTHLNALSQRVLGCALLPEFIPLGNPLVSDSELGTIVPDRQVEEVQEEEECLDITISDAVEILSQRPSEVDTSAPRGASPHTSSQHDDVSQSCQMCTSDKNVSAPRTSAQVITITALSVGETDDIVRLYSKLHQMDKQLTTYSLKSKKRTLPGPWRASRKRSGSAPGQQAAERLFMTHGQAALRPDANRICECVSLRLLKEFELARNRPKDSKGKTLPIPQSMVQSYVHIKQLLEDSLVVQEKTDLVLVTITTPLCLVGYKADKKEPLGLIAPKSAASGKGNGS